MKLLKFIIYFLFSKAVLAQNLELKNEHFVNNQFNHIYQILTHPQKTPLLLTDKGLYLYQFGNIFYSPKYINHTLKKVEYIYGKYDFNQNIWLLTGRGKVNYIKGNYIYELKINDQNTLPEINQFIIESFGDYVAFRYNRNTILIVKNFKIHKILKFNSTIKHISNQDQNLVIECQQKFTLDQKNLKLIEQKSHHTKNNISEKALFGTQLYLSQFLKKYHHTDIKFNINQIQKYICFDSNLIIFSNYEGLYQYHFKEKKLIKLLKEGNITSIVKNFNSIIVSNYDGKLYEFGFQNYKKTKISSSQKIGYIHDLIILFNENDSLSIYDHHLNFFDKIYHPLLKNIKILETKRYVIIGFTKGYILLTYDDILHKKTNQIIKQYFDAKNVKLQFIHAVKDLNIYQNKIYISTNSGLYKMNEFGKIFDTISFNNRCLQSASDHNGSWIIQNFKINYYGNQVFSKLIYNTLNHADIEEIYYDPKIGFIFYDGYCNLYCLKNYKFTHFNIKEHLPKNSVFNDISIKNGLIYFKLNANGIIQLSINNHKLLIKNYYYLEGNHEIKNYIIRDSDIVISNNAFITKINLNRKYNSKNIIFEKCIVSDSIEIPNQSQVDFRYSNFEFLINNSEDNQPFRYKLLNYDSNFYISSNPILQYKYLPPGNYTLYLTNLLGTQSKSFKFTINPPFYNTKLFIAIMIVLFLILGAILTYIPIKYLQKTKIKQLKMKHRITEIELKSLREQMNPHFIFNTLGLLKSTLDERKLNLSKTILSHFSIIVRKYLNYSKSDKITLKDEIELLANYLELMKLRFQGLFEYEIEKPDYIQNVQIQAFMLQPFVENAIIHGIIPMDKKGWLKITFQIIEDQYIIINIIDNGIGLDNNFKNEMNQKIGNNISIKNIKRRINIFNHKLFHELEESKNKFELKRKYQHQYKEEVTMAILKLKYYKI